ncbi:hypothetical protein KO317_00510 [Candidatus Micrarchaeota archaeon]|nr:hypothetical protein [Candidatus Micrarchaeota archaeon]
MNKKVLILLIFCVVLISGNWIDNEYAIDHFSNTTSEGLFIDATQGGILEPGSVISNTWLKNWVLMAIIVILISFAFVALAYIISKTFNITILKAWADVELSQIIVSGIMLALIIVGLGVLDSISELLIIDIFENLGIECVEGQQKAICIANLYLDDTFDTTNKAAKNLMSETLTIGRRAALKEGWALQTLPYMSFSESPDANLRLIVERNSILIDYYGNILASLKAQKYFLNAIGFSIGPIFIVLGLIFRSFFLTRKMGGLLMAIGIGVIVVLPLTYVFAMFTLSIQIYGDEMLSPLNDNCPAECLQQYPLGFNSSDGSLIYSPSIFSPYLPTGSSFYDFEPSEEIWEDISLNHDIVLCDSVCNGCPIGCRELPLTASLCFCDEEACNDCPKECKVIRERTDCSESDSTYYCPTTLCPNECKMNLTPTLNNCWSSSCGDCPADCRFDYADGTDRTTTHPHCPSECDSCMCNVIIPSPYQIDCNLACGDIYWERTTEGLLSDPSSGCPEGCLGYLPETTDGNGCESCADCDAGCRFIDSELRDPDCDFSCCYDCPTECMIDTLPLSPCQGCWECSPDCTTLPQIRTDCASVCGEIKGFYDVRPKELINKIEGAEGETNAKALGILLFPAYILPLLSIILTIAFIRGFSQFLGGDYEIPGLAKLI